MVFLLFTIPESRPSSLSLCTHHFRPHLQPDPDNPQKDLRIYPVMHPW